MMKRFVSGNMNNGRGTTLADVAQAAGVSIGTASSVLNRRYGNVRVSEATKQRVCQAADSLGYRPNILARGLRMKRSGLIGVVVRNLESSIVPQILQGIEDVVKEVDNSVILYTSNDDAKRERHAAKDLVAKKVDGIIISPVIDDESIEFYKSMAECKYPCVCVANRVPGADIPYCLVNGVSVGYKAVKHLLELGHTRIAYLGMMYEPRFMGYKQALEEQGIQVDCGIVEECLFNWNSGREAAERLISRRIDFTAIYAEDDKVALAAIAALAERGLKVPDDISIIGSDDLAMAAMVTPALTTVSQPKRQQGEMAARILFNYIEGRPVESLTMEPELVVRATTRPL
jgi:LacI family transcriptional regulator